MPAETKEKPSVESRAQPLAETYSLRDAAHLLKGFQPPGGKFEPRGAWENVYRICTLTGQGSIAGELRLKRELQANGNARLVLDYRKRVSPKHQQSLQANISVKTDALATPLNWEMASRIEDNASAIVQGTALQKSGKLAGGRLETKLDGKTRRRDLPSVYAANWSLFDAVQRLPRAAGPPREFLLIDHFDQLKPEQRLSYRESVNVAFPSGATARLHAFHQLGRGILPIVYWLDDTGRLLFCISGLEAYSIDDAK